MGNVVTALILISAAAAVIAGMIKRRREGKSFCSCGCKGCSMAEECHSKEKK